MGRNVEIKARSRDFQKQRLQAEALSTKPAEHLTQEDTFFTVPAGRLKLRIFEDGSGELIQYNRDDSAGPKESRYVFFRTQDAEALKTVLAKALGVQAVVRKKRAVYFCRQTRIHLDQVDGLGAFVELEVVLEAGQDIQYGTAVAQDLMRKLGIAKGDLVPWAYVDLISGAG
jgi:predicted adenylyl cyclase CyaB